MSICDTEEKCQMKGFHHHENYPNLQKLGSSESCKVQNHGGGGGGAVKNCTFAKMSVLEPDIF